MYCFNFVYQDQIVNTGETSIEDALLEGHLGITRELLAFQTPEKKFSIGSEKGGSNLIKVGLTKREKGESNLIIS